MAREAVEQLMDRWMNEPAFRAALRHDPEGTVRRAGYTLDEAEWAALRETDWNVPDEELTARASKCV